MHEDRTAGEPIVANRIDQRIASLDVSLFAAIESQSNAGDRSSWLAIQRAKRQSAESYVYLEIGSYLGGSIQPHLMDPRCRRIYSIDRRPETQPDDRGQLFSYAGCTTEQMVARLRTVDVEHIDKIVCFDGSVTDLDARDIKEAPDICLIDGEHTREAVLADWAFCRDVCAADAVVCFHDAHVIWPAIERIVRELEGRGTAHRAAKLGGATFAIALGASGVSIDTFADRARDGHEFIRMMKAKRRREQLGRAVPAFVRPTLRFLRTTLGFRH